MTKPRILAAFAMTLIIPVAAMAAPQFFNIIDGSPLNFDDAMEEGRDTEAVKHFLETGENVYNEDPEILPEAEELYAGMCSGCHGHYAEGKIGPGLNDAYWTIPATKPTSGCSRRFTAARRGRWGRCGAA